jgi:hypothetical protein
MGVDLGTLDSTIADFFILRIADQNNIFFIN